MKKWTIEDSEELYNIKGWGTSYFGINDKGDVYVSPCKDNTQIDLRDIMDELTSRARTSSSTPSKSTKCSPLLKRLSHTVASLI